MSGGAERDALRAAGVDQRHLHEDKASGARDDRPGLKVCLDFLAPGDTLVVWKLDRLGRSLPHLLEIVAELKARGVAFRSPTEAMDTDTPQGELLFSIFGALAQYERALTRERVLAGLAAARRRGRRGGRPPQASLQSRLSRSALLQAQRYSKTIPNITVITKTMDAATSGGYRCRDGSFQPAKD